MASNANMISELYVNVTSKGMETVRSAIKGIQGGAETAQAALGSLSNALSGVRNIVLSTTAPLLAMKAGLLGLAYAGMQGTVEMDMFHRSFQQLTRYIAASFAPILDIVRVGIDKLNAAIRMFGGTGQKVLMVLVAGLIGLGAVVVAATVGFTAMAMAIGVVSAAVGVLNGLMTLFVFLEGLATAGIAPLIGAAVMLAGVQFAGSIAGITAFVGGIAAAGAGLVVFFRDLRQALGALIDAGAQLAQALWPIVKAGLMIAGVLAQAFIVEPLVKFLNILTAIVITVTKLADKLIMTVPLLRSLKMAPDARTEVMLSQTGTESMQGTFARVQEAALRAVKDGEKTMSPLEANTAKIEALVNKIDEWINVIGGLYSDAKAARDTAIDYIAGAGPFGMLANKGMNLILGR
jgi:hypothetical protein